MRSGRRPRRPIRQTSAKGPVFGKESRGDAEPRSSQRKQIRIFSLRTLRLCGSAALREILGTAALAHQLSPSRRLHRKPGFWHSARKPPLKQVAWNQPVGGTGHMDRRPRRTDLQIQKHFRLALYARYVSCSSAVICSLLEQVAAEADKLLSSRRLNPHLNY